MILHLEISRTFYHFSFDIFAYIRIFLEWIEKDTEIVEIGRGLNLSEIPTGSNRRKSIHRRGRFQTCPLFHSWKAIPSETSVTGHEMSGIYAIIYISAWKAVVIPPRLRHGFLSLCSVASFRRRIVERFTMENNDSQQKNPPFLCHK